MQGRVIRSLAPAMKLDAVGMELRKLEPLVVSGAGPVHVRALALYALECEAAHV